MITNKISGMLNLGNEKLVFNSPLSGNGTKYVDFDIQSDTVLLSLYTKSITGTLTVTAYTVGDSTDPQQILEVASFPTLTGPLTNLLLRKAAVSLDTIRLKIVYSGEADIEIRAKAISTGESTVTIKGQASGRASQKTVTATADILIPASLNERAGLIVRNNSASVVIYLGFSLAETTLAVGYPLYPGESLGMAIGAGQDLYAISTVGNVDVRILEAGG
jgi:hypothetical protein